MKENNKMKDKINVSLVITLATILLSVGGSFAVMKSKTEEVDKIKDKAEVLDKKVAVVETKLDGIEDALKEQKEDTKEIQTDLKTILKAVKK